MSMPSLRLDRSRIISSSEASRNFGEVLNRVKEAEELFIARNNAIEAVLVDIDVFERLSQLEEIVEHLEIAGLITQRQAEPEVGTLEDLLAEEGIRTDDGR